MNCLPVTDTFVVIVCPLEPTELCFWDICILSSPFLVVACVPGVVCVPCNLRPCLSYGRCRDRINSVLRQEWGVHL